MINNQHQNPMANIVLIFLDIYNSNLQDYTIEQFQPGTYSVFNLSNMVKSIWEPVKGQENVVYFTPSFSHNWLSAKDMKSAFMENAYDGILKYLSAAVHKRCITTDRPVACLLSGGLDSSLITALVNHYYKTSSDPTLHICRILLLLLVIWLFEFTLLHI